MLEKYLYVGIFTLVMTLIFTPLSMLLARKIGAIDYPAERRIHNRPIPRLGGIAMYLSFTIAVLYFIPQPLSSEIKGLLIGATIILVLGIYDDVKGVSPKVKFGGQLLAAVVLVLAGYRMDAITLPVIGQIHFQGWGIVLVIIWVVSLVNTVNITDGLDGLAAGICFVACLVLMWSALNLREGVNVETEVKLLTALAGVCLGFLFFNFHPAKVFMGDSGSMFLGFTLAAISVSGLLKTPVLLSLVLPLFAMGLPIFDITFAIVRRKWNGQPISLADRGHLHHRLLDLGLTHRQAVLALYSLSSIMGGAAIFASLDDWRWAGSLTLLVLFILFSVLFSKNEREASRRTGGK